MLKLTGIYLDDFIWFHTFYWEAENKEQANHAGAIKRYLLIYFLWWEFCFEEEI